MIDKIRSIYWFNCGNGRNVGAVLIETLPDVYKCYLWPVPIFVEGGMGERTEDEDAEYIYNHGAKVMPHIAKAIFPHAANFKFYDQ